VFNIKIIENEVLSKITFNDVINKLKRKYYIDFQDEFPMGYDKKSLGDFLEQRDLNVNIILEKLKKGSYTFSPFIERKVPKNHKKALILSQGCLNDVIVQMVLNKVLTKNIQAYFSKGLFSGRLKGMKININNLIKRVYKFYRSGKQYAIKLDIKNYYNEINKELLNRKIKKLFGQSSSIYKTIRNYIYSSVLIKGKIKKNKRGIHIGSHIANILSNIYLTEFDKYVDKKVSFYARYADDVFVICNKLKDIKDILKVIKTELHKYGLNINNEKLKIIEPGDDFDYLGFSFTNGKIYIKASSIRKFKNKIRRCLNKNKYRVLTKIKSFKDIQNNYEKEVILIALIYDINELVCGNYYKSWIRYFSKASFSVQFKDLDIWIRNKIRQKLTGRWRSKNYKILPNMFFKKYSLKSMVREYYKYNENWRNFSKPILSRIAFISNLEKAVQYYLDKKNTSKDKEIILFMSNKRRILENINKNLIRGSYKFSKPKKKIIIRYDTHEKRKVFNVKFTDRVVQRAIINIVTSYFDNELSDDVYSYRKGSSVFKGVSKVIRVLRNIGSRKVYKSDFENFNENIDLKILKRKLKILFSKEKDVLEIFSKLLGSLSKIGFLPKGMPLTNFLLNIYLIDFDREMAQTFDCYIRYADDFLLAVSNKYKEKDIDKVVQKEAHKLHLKIKKEKTKFIDKGEFEFLGYKFTIGEKLEISLSRRVVLMIKRKIRRITEKKNYPNLKMKNYKDSQDLQNIIKKINYYFSSRKKMSLCKYFCRVNDFGQLKLLDLFIRDRIRLVITKKMNLKNRKLISYKDLKKLGLISLASWIYLAKRLMYNKLIAYQYHKVSK